MSVLIKGMRMPECCDECVFMEARDNGWGNDYICTLTGEDVDGIVNCPITIVPPHGDLIDAFAFRREMDTKYPFDKFTQSKHGEADVAKSTILMMLAKAPTIIEAEGEDNG